MAIKTVNTGTKNKLHRPGAARTRTLELQEAAPAILQKVTGKTGKGRRIANRFVERVHATSHDEEVIVGIREDYTNKEYSKKAVIELQHDLAPEYQIPRYFRFNISADGDIKDPETYLSVDTNLDFITADGRLHLRTSSGLKDVSPASLLVSIFDAKNELYFTSLYGGEIATFPITSTLIQLKCRDLLSARLRNEDSIEIFREENLKNSYAVREIINSGERDYKDLLKLLHKARKFRHWLQKQEPDINLISAYYKEVTASSWVEKLPPKILRWAILTAAGIALIPANPVLDIGVPAALSASDSLILDHLVQGWRPNQFVEGPLQRFAQLGVK